MKKKDYLWSMLTILMVGLLSIGIISCKEDDPVLKVSKNKVTFDAKGEGDGDVLITVEHTGWTTSIPEGSSWIELSKEKGDDSYTLTISAKSVNTSKKENKGKVLISSTSGNITEEITVTQAAGESSLTVSQSSVDFSVEGGSQTIQVTSNTSWSLNVKDSWLTVNPSSGTEPTSGSETKEVTITANENTANETRTCTLTFKTNDGKASETVTVTQKWLSGLSAEPTDELLMCRGYAYRVSCGPSTKYFYQKMYTQTDYNKMSEKEVISDVVTGKVDDRDTPSDDNFYSWNLNENTNYVLAIVPYGEKDRQGKLYVQKFKTKKSDSEPQVDINNFSIDWDTDSYEWNVTKNTYCASYYMYATASKTYFPTFYWMEEGALALIGWAIRSEMEKDDTNHLAYINQNTWKDWGYSSFTAVEKFYAQQINDGTSYLTANPLSDKYFQIVVWGTKSNGDLSGYLTFGYADWSDTSTNNSRALAPLRMEGAKDGKLKCIRGNLKDFDLIRIE